MENQIFHHAKVYNLSKNPLEKNQKPSRCYNSITSLKFQHKPKISDSFKNPLIKIDRPIIYYLGAY